jgi:hypothetical protein
MEVGAAEIMTTNHKKLVSLLESFNSIYYLAYGANTNNGVMDDLCPGAQCLGNIVLKNWVLKFYLYANVEPQPSASVECVLWRITPEHELSLNHSEDYPNYYTKAYEQIVLPTGEHVEAMLYVMTEHGKQRTGLAAPYPWYDEMVSEGYAQHGISLSQLEQAQGYKDE